MAFKENDKAIYLQIADGICDGILTGTHLPGSRILSVREYASRMEVNANTVMRSYDYLDRGGKIFNRRGIGFFIADDAAGTIRDERRESFFNGEADSFFHRMMTLGITPSEISTLYTEYLNNNQKK